MGAEKLRRISRRALVKRTLWTLLGAGFVVRFLLPRRQAGAEALRVPVAQIPANGALVFRRARIALIREGEEFRALSLVCTHLGCTLSVSEDALTCPCHGSVFDRTGTPRRGPAVRPLDRLPLIQGDGFVEVQV